MLLKFLPDVFIYATLQDSFDKIRKEEEKSELSDVECFARALYYRLSSDADSLPRKAFARYVQVQELSDAVFSKIKVAENEPVAKTERSILKAIIDYEYRTLKKNPRWTFTEQTLDTIAEDFRVIKDFLVGTHRRTLAPLAKKFGTFFLNDGDSKIFQQTKFSNDDERDNWLREKAVPKLQPLWYFMVSLCRLLQEKENPLTASDAYWLGIVNEVIGSKLRCLRHVWEYESPKTPPTQNVLPTAS